MDSSLTLDETTTHCRRFGGLVLKLHIAFLFSCGRGCHPPEPAVEIHWQGPVLRTECLLRELSSADFSRESPTVSFRSERRISAAESFSDAASRAMEFEGRFEGLPIRFTLYILESQVFMQIYPTYPRREVDLNQRVQRVRTILSFTLGRLREGMECSGIALNTISITTCLDAPGRVCEDLMFPQGRRGGYVASPDAGR